MRTVVTGGAGFIGSHLVRRLLDEGRQVVIADDFSTGSMQNLVDLGIEPSDVGLRASGLAIDLKDFAQASKVIEGAQVVYHLAARVGSIEYLHGSEASELLALQTNLVIDANVFRACLENRVGKLIHASSVSVYPISLQQCLDAVFAESGFQTSHINSSTVNPDGGYGWAKVLGEVQLSWMQGLKIGIARIFNVYGENEEPNGENAHVVPALIRKAILYPREKFIVWGDGKQSRDFLYVSDCVDALIRLEDKASSPPFVVNIGSEKTVPIGRLAGKIVELSGKDMKPVYDAGKPVGPLSRTADITKARELLDWEPRVGLDEGLRRTYGWVQARLRGENVS